MKNAILDRIKDFATKELMAAYGYCGQADGDDGAMLNSTDGDGNDIKITINVESD